MTTTKIVYQTDSSGFYLGQTEADESPLEPGVFHLPARCVETSPPASWEEGKWPRWDGSTWRIVNQPRRLQAEDPVEKLRAYLAANPDVAALISGSGEVPA